MQKGRKIKNCSLKMRFDRTVMKNGIRQDQEDARVSVFHEYITPGPLICPVIGTIVILEVFHAAPKLFY
jgi:hypothetical protein